MGRPTTKQDLTEAANVQFNKLWQMLDSIPEEHQNAPFNFSDDFLQKQKEAHWRRDRNLRDVLVHLYEWHMLLLNWVNANQNRNPKPFLPAPYNWKTYGKMNIEFWEKHQNTTYNDAKAMLKESHDKVMKMIDKFSNEELFMKNIFSWTGNSILGSYCVSATSSHYGWATKKIKRHIKSNVQ